MKIFNNLRFRLLLLVAIAVIPALGVTLYSGLKLRENARDNAVRAAFQTIHSLANYQSSIIEGARHTLYSLSLAPELADPQQCNQRIQSLIAGQLYSDRFMIADASGQVYCAAQEQALGVNLASEPFFQESLKSGGYTVGTPSSSADTSYIPLLMPAKGPDGQIAFVIIEMLDMRVVVENESIYNLPEQSAILVIDMQGEVLMRYPQTEQWVGQRLPNAPLIAQILREGRESMTETTGIDNILRFYAFLPLQTWPENRTYLAVGIPSSLVYAEADQTLTQSMALLIISSLLAALTAYYGGDVLFLRVVSLTAERDAAEARLREANQGLETRVAERTAELEQVNQQLQVELAERKRTVAMLRAREAELKHQQVLLERSNRDLQDFAYITSHDLQEPLRKIQAFGDRLSTRYKAQLGEEGALFIDRMVTSARRMQNMINDLLQYSRVSTRGGNFVPTQLNEIISEVLQDLELRMRETGAQIEVAALPNIEADEAQMRQLFMNLIGNALKFRREGVTPQVKIHSTIDQPQPGDEIEKLVICVEDNGIGFEEKYLDRIFQPFQRLHSKDTYEGSGIGLAVCRKIVDRHGGTLNAHSQLGQGSSFTITLPTQQIAEGEEA